MTTIRLNGISKFYGSGSAKVWAVRDVHLQIESGEFFFILGPSGCGKTTLLRIIAGLVEADAGTVHFDNNDVTRLPVEKRNTAMVFQNYALWPHMSVQQNVEFGPRMRGVRSQARSRLAGESLQRVEMESFAGRKPMQLSGGQQQRVALARVLAAQPACMLLDEPLSNLDAQLRLHMRSQLCDLVKSSGTTAVYVTHDQKEALSMADRIAVMDDGRVAQVGTPRELYDTPATRFVAEFLGECNFIEGKVIEAAEPLVAETACGKICAANAGREFACGDSVICCVRPEQIQISAAADRSAEADRSILQATIQTVTFLGDVCQYICRLCDKSSWKVTVLAGKAAGLQANQAVNLSVPGNAVTLLPAGLLASKHLGL